ncbi:lysine-specific demethylase ELF6 isoform X2 [Spinacia oleracea]|uniref:Lysine-specific demethylase ELF6 isoform X2 n=1 Tax=Spinacia oleracea TaxID=3562 RepID=A0ABM3RL51_SPIOL|nr:lysine-specific demethylase ELF6 isoform X2 [Spinacia oleracea]
MMGNVKLPQWLKELPLAPEFRPTETEFADPIAYISKIEKEVGGFGICKVIPPLPKPSRRYVFNNLNKTLLRSRELGLDVNFKEMGDSSKRVSQDKRNNNENRAVFTTRQQELGKEGKRSRGEVDASQPAAQKQVWESGEFYTLEQFESKSKEFRRSVLGTVKEVAPLAIEALFWKAASEKPMYVEYANDVPGSGFGEPEGLSGYLRACKKRRKMCGQGHGGSSYRRQRGVNDASVLCAGVKGEVPVPCSSTLVELEKESVDLPTSSPDEISQSTKLKADPELEGTAGWKLSNCPWNLQVIARSAGSLTRFMLDDIPGVTSPMVYIGMLFSWFAWHVEDHELHSLNFLHTGSPKTWYAIPGEYAFAFEDVIHKQACGGDVDHLAALKLLGEKTTLLSPEMVVASGIPCCRLVQNPGEFVVTFPRAYHVGFSHGFNCGEAANFGTPQWLTIAKEAAVRRAAMDHLPMLSHQQLLYLLTMSFILRDSLSQAGTILDVSVPTYKGGDEDIHHLTTYRRSLNGLYLDSNDVLSDFQVDSGTLVCVACGILGYPIMSVVQPSKTASRTNLSSEKMSLFGAVRSSRQQALCHIQCRDTNNDGTWDTSRFLRPRIFCLEHAVQIEELLRPRGGANMLVICHSDYQKIKANAAAVAEELRTTLNYKEVTLDFASPEELKLIDRAIDDEQLTDFQEDWTTKLGINLRFSVKTRRDCLPKKIEHALNIDYLLSIMAPDSRISNIKWCSRKSRTKRVSNHRTLATYCDGNFSKKDEIIHISNSKEIKGKILLQYSRRKYRNKSRNISGAKHALGCSMECSTEGTDADCGKIIDHNEQDTSGTPCFKIVEGDSEEFDTSEIRVVECKEVETPTGNREPASNRTSGAVIIETCTSASSDSNFLRIAGVVEEPNLASEDLDTENCSSSLASAMPDARKSSNAGKDIGSQHVCTAKASGLTIMCRPEELNDDQTGGDLRAGSISDHALCIAYSPEITGSSVPCKKLEVYANPACNMTENLGGSETCKHDATMMEVDMCNLPKDNLTGSSQTGAWASSLSSTCKKQDNKLANAKMTCGDRRKKQALHIEAYKSYVRSPCEGLRPRKNKDDSVDMVEMTSEKAPTKKLKESLVSSASCNQVVGNKTGYRCNLEGCRIHFRTKVELLLHKHNQCHHKGCRKSFRSHKYVVLHQRVHDDERPLKCTWEGCIMTFKWAWARTEHFRLHTGERPYQCKIKGCGLTFRFVSDYSRHRRKTGHYANQSTK